MDDGVWCRGAYHSDSARNLTKQACDLAALTVEVVEGTLTPAEMNTADIGVVHVANAFGELFAGQGHLGAMPGSVCDALGDPPGCGHTHAASSKPGWFLFDVLVRHDQLTGSRRAFSFGDGVGGHETATAPRAGATAGPVRKPQLPESVSRGTHSTWSPGPQLRRSDTAESAAGAIGP